MKSIEKLPWLASLEIQTEGYIHDAVERFQNSNENILNKPALNGGWSITQCLAHLNTYGHYYLPLMENGITKCSNLPSSDVYTSSLLGTYLIRLTDPQKGPMKLKAAKRHQPPGLLSAYQIVAEFIDQQETMLDLIRKAQGADLNHYRIPLSIASWVHMPLGDILHFMVVHTKRHVLQANRNMQHPYM